LPFSSFDEINLDYATTEYSAKTYFLPYKETLSSFNFEDDDWTQEIKYRTRPRVIIGLHPCDINALIKLDKVFEKTLFPNPYYITRRQNMEKHSRAIYCMYYSWLRLIFSTNPA